MEKKNIIFIIVFIIIIIFTFLDLIFNIYTHKEELQKQKLYVQGQTTSKPPSYPVVVTNPPTKKKSSDSSIEFSSTTSSQRNIPDNAPLVTPQESLAAPKQPEETKKQEIPYESPLDVLYENITELEEDDNHKLLRTLTMDILKWLSITLNNEKYDKVFVTPIANMMYEFYPMSNPNRKFLLKRFFYMLIGDALEYRYKKRGYNCVPVRKTEHSSFNKTPWKNNEVKLEKVFLNSVQIYEKLNRFVDLAIKSEYFPVCRYIYRCISIFQKKTSVKVVPLMIIFKDADFTEEQSQTNKDQQEFWNIHQSFMKRINRD